MFDLSTIMVGLVLIAFILIALFLFLFFKKSTYPYEKQNHIFTRAEQVFLKSLDHAMKGSGYRVFGKLRIADVLRVSVKQDKKKFWYWFTKISSKHFDYVLVNEKTYEPIIAIELDDASHQRKDRQDRDIFVNKACHDAGFPLLRIPLAKRYDSSEILSLINQKINEYKELNQ